MRRERKRNPREYIEVRIKQLIDDRRKAKDSLDKEWYLRIISELRYVLTIIDKSQEACMNFFEMSQNQLDAMKLAEYMQNLTYRIKEDHEMANRLSRCADKLSEIDANFGTRWDRDFDKNEKALIRQCHKMMSESDA